MNKEALRILANNNRRTYKTPKGETYTPEMNAVYLYSNNKVNHEMAKCLGAYQIKKWGDVCFNARIIELLKELDKEVTSLMKAWPKNPKPFITEAIPRSNTKRRADLIEIETDTLFEFENNHSIIKKKGVVTIYI